MCPAAHPPKGKIIGIGFQARLAPVFRCQLIIDIMFLAIGDSCLFGRKTQFNLAGGISRRLPAHQGIWPGSTLARIFQYPVLCLASARLHGCFRWLINSGSDHLQAPHCLSIKSAADRALIRPVQMPINYLKI
jgi:hypothetical protein